MNIINSQQQKYQQKQQTNHILNKQITNFNIHDFMCKCWHQTLLLLLLIVVVRYQQPAAYTHICLQAVKKHMECVKSAPASTLRQEYNFQSVVCIRQCLCVCVCLLECINLHKNVCQK